MEDNKALDIRGLLRAEMARRCWADAEAARAAGVPPSSLRQTLDGTRSVSGKMLAKIIEKWDVKRRPDLLQQWLLAFLVEQLSAGAEGPKLLRKARLWPSATAAEAEVPVAGRPESAAEPAVVPFEPYAPLGDNRLATRRRLALLRLLYTRGPHGAVLPELCSAVRDTGSVVRTELKYLQRHGFAAVKEMRRTRVSHPVVDRVESISREARLQVWWLVEPGAKIVEALKGLPDLEASDFQ